MLKRTKEKCLILNCMKILTLDDFKSSLEVVSRLFVLAMAVTKLVGTSFPVVNISFWTGVPIKDYSIKHSIV